MFGESPPKSPLTSLTSLAPPLTQPVRPAAQAVTAGDRRIDSATLLGPGGELFIDHQQQVYRLRLTSQGKLILTK